MRWGAIMLAFLVAMALGASACGGTEDESPSADAPAQEAPAAPAAEEPSEPEPPAERYADDDPEALLATIDNDGDKPDDAEIDPYAERLDKMERFCRESRSLLADQVVNGAKILKDEKKLDYTNLEMARAYTNALTAKLGRKQECAESSLACWRSLPPRSDRRLEPAEQLGWGGLVLDAGHEHGQGLYTVDLHAACR